MPWIRPRTDTPFGLIPYGPVLRIQPYRLDATHTAIYPGDLVVPDSGGFVSVLLTTESVIGVAAEYSAASTATTDFKVYDHPDQLFLIQEDSDTSFATVSQINLNYAAVATTGDTSTRRSRMELDTSSGVATGAGVTMRLINLMPGEALATSAGNQRKCIVMLTNHTLNQTTGI